MLTCPPPTDTIGCPLIVTAATAHSVAFTVGQREYRASLHVRHHCAHPARLAPDDALTILRRGLDGDVFAEGPCGCPHLLSYVGLIRGTWTDV
jgi:hypothetical protein